MIRWWNQFHFGVRQRRTQAFDGWQEPRISRFSPCQVNVSSNPSCPCRDSKRKIRKRKTKEVIEIDFEMWGTCRHGGGDIKHKTKSDRLSQVRSRRSMRTLQGVHSSIRHSSRVRTIKSLRAEHPMFCLETSMELIIVHVAENKRGFPTFPSSSPQIQP